MKSYDEIAKSVLERRDAHNIAVKQRNRIALRIGVPAVTVCLALTVAAGFYKTYEKPDIQDGNKTGETDKIIYNQYGWHTKDEPSKGTHDMTPEYATDGDEVFIEPHWNEKELYEKYHEFIFDSATYTTTATWIDEDKLDCKIGISDADGYDIYDDREYKIGVTVYSINGISKDAAVAVSYDGTPSMYAVYICTAYKPQTLGEFIDALGLRENLTFGSIYHTSYVYESYMTVEYSISDTSVIWNMLLSDGTLENAADEGSDNEMSYYNELMTSYKESMSVSVNVDILGIKNVSLGVTENGYLTTNILGTRKLFYIGEDKVKEFFEYVKTNFETVREEYPSDNTVNEQESPHLAVTTTAVTSPPCDTEIWVEE